MKVRGFTSGIRMSRTRGDSYYIDLWEQPLHRWVIAEIYHWYNMRVFRLPGFRRLERALHRWEERRRGDIALPLGAKQDCRCYELQRKGRRDLGTITVTDRAVILSLWPTAPELREMTDAD